jgi:hypothetical protein
MPFKVGNVVASNEIAGGLGVGTEPVTATAVSRGAARAMR